MEQDVYKAAALRGRPTDENTEELLDLIRNQEKDVNPDVMFENIVLKKACLKPLQDVPLPSINPNETVLSLQKSKSFSGHWPCSSFTPWKNTELVRDKNYERRRKCSEPWKTILLDSAKDSMESSSETKLRTRSLPPLGFAFDEDFQRPGCPTPSQKPRCKGKAWEEEYEWKE